MFELTVRGKTLEELKSNLIDIHDDFVDKLTHKDKVQIGIGYAGFGELKEPSIEVDIPVKSEKPPLTKEIDINGIPWDKRIHSSSQDMNKDGSWKKRKNVDKDYYDHIVSQLKGESQVKTVAAPSIPSVPVVETQVSSPAVETPAPVAPIVAPTPILETPAPVAAPTPILETPILPLVAPLPSNKVKHTLETFKGDLSGVLTNLVIEGKIDQGYLSKLCAYFNVNAIWDIREDAAKVEELYTQLVKLDLL